MFEVAFDYHQDVTAIEQNLLLVKKSHLEGILTSLWHLDNQHLKIQIQGVLSLPGIRYVEVTDNHGQQVIALGEKPSGRTMMSSYPLNYKTSASEVNLGSILVVASLEEVYQKIYWKIFFVFLTQSLKSIIITIFIYVTINKILIKPLLLAAEHMKNLDFRKSVSPLKLKRSSDMSLTDELDILIKAINNMQRSLFQSYQELNSFNADLEEKVRANTAVIIDQRGKLEYTTKMSALGEMAGGIAHEINTPLTVIQLSSEKLLMSLSSDALDFKDARAEMNTSLERIVKTVSRISKIISGLRTFARDSKDEIKLLTSISEIVEDTFSLCREKLSHNKTDLKFILDSDIKIYCNPIELSQVLLNLLNNAYDAIQDSPDRWIRVELEAFENHIYLSVVDSGHGISKDLQEKIMQPFFTTKEIGKGTGLGLSISKGIIEAHGGKLFIDTKSANTKLTIMLPLTKKQLSIS
ncbi:MAG: ATP-binding protein [Pseudobdellovibrio sp.]